MELDIGYTRTYTSIIFFPASYIYISNGEMSLLKMINFVIKSVLRKRVNRSKILL